MSETRTEPLFKIQRLRSGYGAAEVLHGIDLQVNEREAVAVLGPNGAGKTTLLRSVFQTCKVFGGSVKLAGTELLSLPPYRVNTHGVSIAPEGRGLFPEMSVTDNLYVGGLAQLGRRELRRRVDDLTEIFPIIKERKHQVVGTMSGGQQQMVAIARALMPRPRILLLDEPSLGLGPQVVEDIFQRLAVLRDEGLSLVIVEQRVQEALEVADRAYVLSDGEVVASGTSAALRTDKSLVQAFFGTSDDHKIAQEASQ
jgi:branched-chain amino acid transport system ATP-binding protein